MKKNNFQQKAESKNNTIANPWKHTEARYIFFCYPTQYFYNKTETAGNEIKKWIWKLIRYSVKKKSF